MYVDEYSCIWMIEILESQNVLRRNRFSLIFQMKFSELPVSHGGPGSRPPRQPLKSPAPDSIKNFTIEYRTKNNSQEFSKNDRIAF